MYTGSFKWNLEQHGRVQRWSEGFFVLVVVVFKIDDKYTAANQAYHVMGQDSTPEECHDLFVRLLTLDFLFVHLFCLVCSDSFLWKFSTCYESLLPHVISLDLIKIPAVYSRLTLCINAKVVLWLRSITLFFRVFNLWDWWLKQLLMLAQKTNSLSSMGKSTLISELRLIEWKFSSWNMTWWWICNCRDITSFCFYFFL